MVCARENWLYSISWTWFRPCQPNSSGFSPGSDADLVFFDPDRTMTISAATQHQRVDYTPYEGMRVQGVPAIVLLRGKVIVRDGEYVGGKGGGQYLPRKTFTEP